MKTERAAKYRRISDDREGRELGVTRQDEDLDKLAERRNLTIVADYEDNDIGASTRSTKARPDYARMIADAKAGQFDVILAYTSGRLTRRPREHEDLIDLAEKHGIRFEYVASPSFDLNTAAGRRIARILAANDAGEAEDIAERVSRAAQQRAEKGEWHGGTPTFGFDAVKEVQNGRERVVDLRPHSEHAAWVNEAIERLLAGESLYGICVEWNRLGRRTGWKRRDHQDEENNTWYPRTLKRVVTAPAIAGYREHDGELYDAKWQPIVDRDDWLSLRTLLGAPERKSRGFSNGNARKYELSGLVFCAGTRADDGKPCERVMVSMTSHRTRANGDKFHRLSFTCNELATGGCGSMRIEMEHLERYIEVMVFTRADSPKLRAAVNEKADDIDEDEKALRKEISDDERRLRRVEDEYDSDEITKAEYQRRRKAILERQEANEAALAKATRSRVHTRLPSGSELRAQWPEKDNIWKRTMLASIIRRIEISPHPAGVATNLTPRKGEDADAFARRLDLHRAKVLKQRVKVHWWH